MRVLLAFARLIDFVNEHVGRASAWLVLIAVLVSSANAIMRYAFNVSSNAWLEIQWYLFSAVFLLAAGYTLLHHAHVRIDILYARWSPRTRAWIDLLGTLFFLMPMALLILYFSWPMFTQSYLGHEISSDAGGRGGGDGHRDGTDFASHHDALRLFAAAQLRRDRGIRHACANHPAFHRARGDG